VNIWYESGSGSAVGCPGAFVSLAANDSDDLKIIERIR
jgi:hypothetical protein